MYVASRRAVAVREAAGALMVGSGVIDADWADARSLSEVPGSRRRSANLRSSRAPDFGVVPGEITGAFAGYRITIAWPHTFYAHRFDGIRHSARFASPPRVREASFGESGLAEGIVNSSMPRRDVIGEFPDWHIVVRRSSWKVTIER